MVKENTKVFKTSVLEALIRESRIRIMFGIARSLVAPVIHGASFLHRFIKEILPSEKKTVSFNSIPVQNRMVHEAESEKTNAQKDDTAADVMAEEYIK